MQSNTVGIIVDDHQLFADSFSSLLEHTNFFAEIQLFTNTKQLFQYLIQHPSKKGCLFLDYYLNDQVGINDINLHSTNK